MRYKLAVYIGRFQPFHVGHAHAVKSALKIADRVLILVGSSYQPRTVKNPFSYSERASLIMMACADDISRLQIAAIQDYPYQEHEWIAEVQRAAAETLVDGQLVNDEDIVLVGHEKDESSYYLKVFPQWAQVDTGLGVNLDATQIRDLIFEIGPKFSIADQLNGKLHPQVCKWIDSWRKTARYSELVNEWDDLREYKRIWSSAPYKPTFVTVDSVVVQSGHVLMVQRGKSPGRGLWALPGGFVDEDERLVDAAIRELKEETSIKLQEDTIRRCLRATQVFDAPGRDLRGRTFTHAHLFALNDAVQLPKVKGSDDAMNAKWVKLSELEPEDIYSDHYHIIQSLLGKL